MAIAAPTIAVDHVTASVIQGALENIAVEMGYKLMRMSYSSIIRESEDFGAALVDAQGRGLAESAQSTPLQSGPIPGYVRGVLRLLQARGDTLAPGDVIMHNDAYTGASHGPDVAFIVPVFHEEQCIAFACTTAHHLDIGALSPGSCGIVDALDAYAEGLQFKAIKVYERGRKIEPVWQLLRDNIRVSDLVVGDMEAQIAAARIGAERLQDLVRQYGLETFQAACDVVMDYAERLMRQAIARLPDGTYSATTMIDGFLDDPDPQRRDLPIQATVTVAGDEITVDLTGTADAGARPPDQYAPGRHGRRCRLADHPLRAAGYCRAWPHSSEPRADPTDHDYCPQRLPGQPEFPAPTIARFCPGNQLADTVMKALSQAVPRQVSAGIGNLKVIAFSGTQAGRQWVHMEIFEGSYGGRFRHDGMDAVDTLYANTRNNPIEDIESHLPLRVTRYELREDACGAGQWRGGFGSVREFVYLSDGGASVEGEGHRYRPWGFDGGLDGHPAQLRLERANGQVTPLPSKVPHTQVKTGDRFVCIGPAGGGYGQSFARDPQRVLDDVLDGLISIATAQRDFGVVISADGTVDVGATARARVTR